MPSTEAEGGDIQDYPASSVNREMIHQMNRKHTAKVDACSASDQGRPRVTPSKRKSSRTQPCLPRPAIVTAADLTAHRTERPLKGALAMRPAYADRDLAMVCSPASGCEIQSGLRSVSSPARAGKPGGGAPSPWS